MFSFWYFGHMKIKLSWKMSSLYERYLVTVKVLYSLTLYYIGGYIVHVFATGGNWGSESVFLQPTGEFSESGEVPQIPRKF